MAKTKREQAALYLKWAADILKLAKRTARYERCSDSVADLVQEGVTCLVEHSESDDASLKTLISSRMSRYIRKTKKECLGDVESVEDDPRTETQTPMFTSDLSTDDQADYLCVVSKARAILRQILSAVDFPATYQTILKERFLSETPASFEALFLSQSFWIDPLTGTKILTSEQKRWSREHLMEGWFAGAITAVQRTLIEKKWLTSEERLLHALLHCNVGQNRVLTKQGQIVCRWLELEAKFQRPGYRRTIAPVVDLQLGAQLCRAVGNLGL